LFLAAGLFAQSSPKLDVPEPPLTSVKRGETAIIKVTATLDEGFHLNSHTPPETYLIPLTLKWTPGPLEAVDVRYPPPQSLKVPFDPKPLSVLTGKFEIATKFKAAAGAPTGPVTVVGKLRYQACNDKACFPPKTIDVKAPVEVK
jgi:hypothetical protein